MAAKLMLNNANKLLVIPKRLYSKDRSQGRRKIL
jgi:hypothetical protein